VCSSDLVITGALDALPVTDVGSVFGFDKTLVETPRSASTISEEQMERFGITEIYDLVAQAPGTFTNSFFGVGGALDIRGTPGEVYFRGVRRLDNPGNYPTPIGASDRIDIVRGPASPIFGPSKTGGYMNFVPKSARVSGGKLLDAPEGEVSFTRGSWSKNVLSASLRGPGKLGSQEFGYSLYGEIEDSDSYYRNMSTRQTIIQAAFDTDLGDRVRIEFGGMYHKYHGQQNGGWNRLTQDLVDNGTYITGSAQPLDTDGDGLLSADEFVAVGGLFGFAPFYGGGPATATAADFAAAPYLAITNVGTAKLSRRDTLTGPNDKLNNTAKTAYFDIIFDAGDDLEIKNQFFYDGYTNLNENAYGFSQFADSWVIEDRIVVSKKVTTDIGVFQAQLSPSIR
jgi:iron complex outermembrane receptor protein